MFDKYYVTWKLFTCHTLTFPNVDSYLINITLSESYLRVTLRQIQGTVQSWNQMIKEEVALEKSWDGGGGVSNRECKLVANKF